jgi:hypothetical protein
MGFSYYGEPISKNILRNPADGTLICMNAVIARTGFQTYRGIDVADELRKIGVDADPYDTVQVYRSPEEVFSKATIASFEGKPVTQGHPDDLLNSRTIREHQCGHVQHVRKGTSALPTGDWPLLADLVVTDDDLIQMIESGSLRQLSCGYEYQLVKDGNRILQVDIVGNHVAIVPVGRAGKHASIRDSAMKTVGELRAIARIESAYQEAKLMRLATALNRRLAQSGKHAVARDGKPEKTPEDYYKEARERLRGYCRS